MGSWGKGPLQNDSAVDWLSGKLQKFLEDNLDYYNSKTTLERNFDKQIAIIYTITILEFKPNFLHAETCPLGWKFPNQKIIEKAINCIENIEKEMNYEDYSGGYGPAKETVKELKKKLKKIEDKLKLESF